MKTKTIKTIISKKLNEWLITLPENLRDSVRKNLLVSGGSISSMLLKEDVNDYDIYIQDINVLSKLANHYCPNNVLDGRLREKYLETRFPQRNDEGIPLYDEGAESEYLAEEFIRIDNLKPDQIKLNIPSVGKRFEVEEKDANGNNNYLVTFLSQNAISLSNDIQIVLRFSGTVEEIHSTFDFIHATNYFTFKDGLVLNLDAMTSLMTKHLKYQGSLYPITSIIRARKFIKRGWNIGAGELLKIMYQISMLDLRNVRVLEEQLIGVDVAYFGLLIDALRGVARDDMSPNYVNNLIDKIFDESEEEEHKSEL